MLIPTSQNIKTITDMRERASELLRDINSMGLIYLFQHSDPKAVMLSMDEFTRMQELIQDHLDEMEAKKLIKEKRGAGIPLKVIISKYTK